MRTGIVLLGLIVLLLLVAVVPVPGGLSASAIYYSPLFILLLALLCGSCVWCCLQRRPSSRKLAFLLVHLAVVLILAGAFAGYLFGEEGNLRLPLGARHYADSLPPDTRAEARPRPLGFEVAADDFQVEFYPPRYTLFALLPREEVERGQMPYEAVKDYDIGSADTLSIEGVGELAVSNLRNEADGTWLPQYRLPNGMVLSLSRQTPAFYGVTLLLRDGELETERRLEINAPASYGGWRFYLMSYDSRNRSYVDLFVRRDPGRAAVIAGMWILIAGVFLLAFQRRRRRNDDSD